MKTIDHILKNQVQSADKSTISCQWPSTDRILLKSDISMYKLFISLGYNNVQIYEYCYWCVGMCAGVNKVRNTWNKPGTVTRR